MLPESLNQRAGDLHSISWDGLSLILTFLVFLSVLILLRFLSASVECWYDLVVNVNGTFGLLGLLLLSLLLLILHFILWRSTLIHGGATSCGHEARLRVFLLVHWHTLLLKLHPAHAIFQAWHALFLAEVLLRLSELRRLLSCHRALEVIVRTSHHVSLRGFRLVHPKMSHDQFFYGRVEHGLSNLVDFKLDYLCSIIVLVHGCHALPVLQLAYVYGEPPHPLNVFLDLFGIVEPLLLHGLLLDLLEYPQLRHDLRVHPIEILRLSHDTLAGPLALGRALGQLVALRGVRACLLQVIRADAVQGDEADLVEDVEVVQMALVEDELQEEGRRVHVD